MTVTANLKHQKQVLKTSLEKVVIIIPTYNECSVIRETIQQVFRAAQTISSYEVHVLVFDSASQDGTPLSVQSMQKEYPHLHLQTEASKSGLGSAYLQAMRYALDHLAADILIEFDADLSHQPIYLKPMLEQLKTCDVVVGSRYIQGGSIPKNWAGHRKCFSVLGNYVARLTLTPKYKDFTSGFRASRSSFLKKILPQRFLSDHYAYKLHLLWLLHLGGANITEYPIAFIDREKGHSKLPKNSVFDSLRVVFTLRLHQLRAYFSMCLVGALGLGLQFLVYNLLRHYLTPFEASQWAVSTAILNNFILNNRFTFKSRIKPRSFKAKRLIVFVTYSIAMIYLQSYWVYWGTNWLGKGSLQENSILAIGVGLGSFINYMAYSRHIWPRVNETVY